jgi:shikimate kinase
MPEAGLAARILPGKSIVLVGLMGAGKSSVGRRVASRLGLPFFDADHEIEEAAGCSISDLFARYGETAFRDGERRVMVRLLSGRRAVIATGGGAFIDPQTRGLIAEKALSLWLRADLDLLVKRTSGRDHRPLLRQGDPRQILAGLIETRYPIYAEADLVVDSEDQPTDITVQSVLRVLAQYQESQPAVKPQDLSSP